MLFLGRPRADLTTVELIKCAFGYNVAVMFSEHMGPRISRVTLFGEELRQTLICNAAGVGTGRGTSLTGRSKQEQSLASIFHDKWTGHTNTQSLLT